jgi:hypothetical protein
VLVAVATVDVGVAVPVEVGVAVGVGVARITWDSNAPISQRAPPLPSPSNGRAVLR